MTPPARKNLTACPVCGKRLELLTRQHGLVSAGCDVCRVSLTFTESIWDQAKAERDAIRPVRPPI